MRGSGVGLGVEPTIEGLSSLSISLSISEEAQDVKTIESAIEDVIKA